MTPAEAFLPNSVDCGPRRTSMREEQDDLIDLGAASALTLGDKYDTKDESLMQPDSWH